MNKIISTFLACLVGFLLFFGSNVLANATLRSWRVDLTEENLYTLTDGSRNIASDLGEPINLYFFFSEGVASKYSQYASYGKRVREMLDEYVIAGDGKIRLEIIEPLIFSEEEDRAVEEGLYGAQVSGSEKLYFGLVGSNSTDDKETIPFFDVRRERFLEYDVSELIYTLTHPDKKVVGVVSTLPLEGSPPNPMLGQQGSPGWRALEQVRGFFETRMLGADFELDQLERSGEEDDEFVDLLLIIHPRGLSESAEYAIDQFVLGGGKAVAYVDPWCEADLSTADPNNPMARGGAPSEFRRMLEAWGVDLVDGKVVGDRKFGLRIVTGSRQSPEQVQYVVWMGLKEDAFDREDPTISEVQSINLASAGILRKREGADVEFTPLMRSSEESMQIDVGTLQFMPDPKGMLDRFVAEHEELALAARIHGNVSSAFPNGAPGAPDEAGEGEDAPAAGSDHRASSDGPINVIVVADADHLQDQFWMQEDPALAFLGVIRKVAENADFLLNSLENFSGDDNLISIRATGKFQRPFERVMEIEREAEQRYRAEEQRLQQELQNAQTKIADLQRTTGEGNIIISEETLAEIARFREEEVSARKNLREVRFNLEKDVKSLGTRLKWLNILAIPGLLLITALGLYVVRVGRSVS